MFKSGVGSNIAFSNLPQVQDCKKTCQKSVKNNICGGGGDNENQMYILTKPFMLSHIHKYRFIFD